MSAYIESIAVSNESVERIECTDMIILPSNLAKKYLEKIKYVKIIALGKNNIVFGRVQSYSSDNNRVILPTWMKDILDHNIVIIESTELLQPPSLITFIPHDKLMVETLLGLKIDVGEALTNLVGRYTCLSLPSTIELKILGKTWKINIINKENDSNMVLGIDILDKDINITLDKALNDIDIVLPVQEYLGEPAIPISTPKDDIESQKVIPLSNEEIRLKRLAALNN